MKRLFCLALMLLSTHSMAGTIVFDEGTYTSHVADVMPGRDNQPNALIPGVTWQGVRVEKSEEGVCTRTVQFISGYERSLKMGINLRIPKVNTQTSVVPCVDSSKS